MIFREDIYILIGCEESQAITIAFRALGFQAFSCDLKPCSGGHPEWHLQMDVFEAIKMRRWHAAIFHPDCTFLAVSGLFRNLKDPIRDIKTEKALQFVCNLLNCGIRFIALENPVGCISTRIVYTNGVFTVSPLPTKGFKPAQIVQPYEFGEDASKATCLWLKNLKPLTHTKRIPGRKVDGKERWANQTDSGQNRLGPSAERAALRSKTYPGIAQAIANQWGPCIEASYQLQDLLYTL